MTWVFWVICLLVVGQTGFGMWALILNARHEKYAQMMLSALFAESYMILYWARRSEPMALRFLNEGKEIAVKIPKGDARALILPFVSEN